MPTSEPDHPSRPACLQLIHYNPMSGIFGKDSRQNRQHPQSTLFFISETISDEAITTFRNEKFAWTRKISALSSRNSQAMLGLTIVRQRTTPRRRDSWNGPETSTDARVSEQAERFMIRPTFALTLPSDLRMLSVARSFVEAVCHACALERSALHAMVLATGEAVTNIVRHAHRDIPGAEMQIVVEVESDRVALTFLDQGQPFDIASVPQLPPGELRIGGRGVFLLRTLMDEIDCRQRTDRPGNVLHMIKRHAANAKCVAS